MSAPAEFPIDPKNGTGSWLDFNIPLERIFQAAAEWKQRVDGIKKPWLCWNVSPRWCVLQQRLVQTAGWTPVIGYDPRIGPPPVLPGSVLIDFNASFQLPVMWPHFPLEFAFLWTDRLAFWHADLLCRLPVLEQLTKTFESLEDGQMAAVLDKGGRRNYLNFKSHRYWELCGCTTAGASENQFYNGTGWWRFFWLHPKCRVSAEIERRKRYSYDSGVGILYWKNNYNGPVVPISIYLVKEGHCSEIMSRNYRNAPNHLTALRDLPTELDANYNLDDVAQKFGIAHLL
jgi:hypothetical protein